MKKIIILIATLLYVFSGCDVLDVKDKSNYGPNVWDDEKLAEAYLANLYNYITHQWPRNGGNSDECMGILGLDAITPDQGGFKPWYYIQIREINLLLRDIENGSLPAKIKDPIVGQALFIRAYLYFEMVKNYGGMPIIKVPQDINTDDLKVKRAPTSECFDFILDDLKEAAKRLPEKYDGANFGRVDQGIVAAYRGRVQLYRASPQFNPANPYDNGHWEAAYNDSKYAYDFLAARGYELIDNYTNVFETKRHSEVVFAIQCDDSNKSNGRGEDNVRPLSESKNSTGGDQPTWGFIQAFPMKDGKKPGESAYTYNEQRFWENRDPRFDQTIVYNGGIYELSGKTGRRQYTTPGIANSLDAFGPGIQGEHHNRTGLYCKKGILEQLPVAEVTLNDLDRLEIRFAEVWFNYAEAANEYQNDQTVGYDVLKAVRARAGIEPGAGAMYGLKTGMTREEMRQALLDERRIEFCFEGFRFWDLRRHRLLHTYLHGQAKFGVLANITITDDVMERAGKYTLMPEEFSYEFVDLIFQSPNSYSTMFTPETYYFFPISKSQIDRNPNLEQNKDWGGAFDPLL